MGFTESSSCTEINDVPFTRDCIRSRDLSKCVYQPDLGQSPSADHRHAVGARTAHCHSGIAPDGTRPGGEFQSLSPGSESGAVVGAGIEPVTAPGVDRSVGRPREKGARLEKLSAVLVNPKTVWAPITVEWYDGQRRALEMTTGTALWKRAGLKPLPIRWVLVRDPSNELEPRAYCTIDPTQTAVKI